jgi:hypothetical protein
MPEIFFGNEDTNVFEKDCRLTNNGGGLPEKVARFRRLREVAFELQDEVDKITKENAMNELVEEVWNAPLEGRGREINKIIKSGKWNNKVNRIKNLRLTNINDSENAPNIPFRGKLPTKKDTGMNNIMMMEDDDIIVFHHKQRDGSEKNHGTTKENLGQYIINNIKVSDEAGGTFGHCFLYPQACDSILHPEEIKEHIPESIYNSYRVIFNKKIRDQSGGNSDNVFQKATDAVCAIGKNTNRFQYTRNKNNSSSKRNTRKHRI